MTAPPVLPMPPRSQPTQGPTPDVVEQLIQQVEAAIAAEAPPVQDLGKPTANQKMEPNPPEDEELTDPIERRAAMMAALYGDDFPLILALREAEAAGEMMFDVPTLAKYTTQDEWCSWARQRWDAHRAAVSTHLWLIQRNRLYRAGLQWVSSKGRGPWREPPRQAESARIVHNLEDKALDQRLQVMTDQRPGFEVDPNTFDPDEKRKATARQQALEFLYDAQRMEDQARDAAYWAGTDGVAFWHVYWDRDAGPWDTRMGPPGGKGLPLGDLRTQSLRCEQVRVSSNTTATQDPLYAVLRDVIPESEATYLYGAAAVSNKGQMDSGQMGMAAGSQLNESGLAGWVMDMTNPGEAERMRNVPTVDRYTVYVDRHPDLLPEGLQLVVVGNALVWGPDDLQFGVIPVIPVRDGSSDPSYYPRPIQEQWHDHQMQLNAALSLVVNSIRVNSSGRLVARPNAIQRETLVGGTVSVIEVEGAGPLADVLMPLQGFSVGQDVKDFVTLKIKAFEDASGYNDISRGQISGDASGRAIMAAREQLERVFAPPVNAMAKAYVHWARVCLAGCAWGYDTPRDMATVGKGRPDLARALSAKEFTGPANVRIEEESLMPLPKSYRMYLLDTWHDKGIINNQQYMRRAEFGMVDDISTPDEDQDARAKRICDAIRLGEPLPTDPNDTTSPLALRWTDNEAIHQDVLEREILLQDDLSPQIVAAAQMRWAACAKQAQQKAPPTSPTPGTPEAMFQTFTQKISNEAIQDAINLIARAIATTDYAGGIQAPLPPQRLGPSGAPPTTLAAPTGPHAPVGPVTPPPAGTPSAPPQAPSPTGAPVPMS